MTAARRAPGPTRAGGLEPRTDPFSAVWALAVVGIFVVVFALPFFGVPSRFIPEATPAPLPTLPETPAVTAPGRSPDGSPETSPDTSPEESPDASPEQSPET